MKTRIRGFASVLLVLALAALIGIGLYAYSKYSTPTGGTSVQTQLSDTLGTFRTNTNTNFSNIDSEIASITSTQASYGTMALVNSPVPVVNGGTGTTTVPSNAQFLSASGTSPAWKTLTFGSGLNSTTTATSVQISTQGIDTTANYTWSGSHSFASTTTFTASGTVTFNGTTTVNGNVSFANFPTVATTSPTSSLQLAPKGYVDANLPTLYSTTTVLSASAGQNINATSSTSTIIIPSNAIYTLNNWSCTQSVNSGAGSMSINTASGTVWSATPGAASVNISGQPFTATWVSTSTGAQVFSIHVAGSSNTGALTALSCTPIMIFFYH